jgi:tRNA(Ile)-lysidine synthase
LCGFRADPTVAARTGASLHLSNRLRADRSPRELRLFLQK